MNETKVDSRSFYLGRFYGAVSAWCEAARAGAKKMSLSSPFQPEDFQDLLPYVKKAAEDNEVQFYLEKELMTTDLFHDVNMSGKWVFMIFKQNQVFEAYLRLKSKKEQLEKYGRYSGEARKDVARSMGAILGYEKNYVNERLKG